MQQDILIIGVLFLAIPLTMINFCNCYTILANLIRILHDEVFGENISQRDAKRFLLQIHRLPDWLRLMCIIQSYAAMAFVLAMISACFDERTISSMLFLSSISLLIVSILIFTLGIQITNTALDVHLSDLE